MRIKKWSALGGAAMAMALASSGYAMQLTWSGGNISAHPQTVSGQNNSNEISVQGQSYFWDSITLNGAALAASCTTGGSIPYDGTLLTTVMGNLPAAGNLTLKYCKTSSCKSTSTSWDTPIGGYDYYVYLYGWTGSALTVNSDGSSTVAYQGGSINIYKKSGSSFLAAQVCKGSYVNFNMTAL